MTKQDPNGAAMHADQDRLLIWFVYQVLNCGCHSFHHIIGALPAFDAQPCSSFLPLGQHKMVIFVFLGRYPMSFFRSPTDFVESNQRSMRNTPVNELLHRLFASPQSGGVNLVKRNMLVRCKKRLCLTLPQRIEISVHSTALYNIFEVEIGLAVTYEVNFFGDQFCAILAPPSRLSGICS